MSLVSLMMVVLFFNSINMLIVSPMLSIGPIPNKTERSMQRADAAPAHHRAHLAHARWFVCVGGCRTQVAHRRLFDGADGGGLRVQLHEFYRRYFFASGEPKRAGASSMWRYSLQGIGLVVLFVSDVTDLNVLFWLVAASAHPVADLRIATIVWLDFILRHYAAFASALGSQADGSLARRFFSG